MGPDEGITLVGRPDGLPVGPDEGVPLVGFSVGVSVGVAVGQAVGVEVDCVGWNEETNNKRYTGPKYQHIIAMLPDVNNFRIDLSKIIKEA